MIRGAKDLSNEELVFGSVVDEFDVSDESEATKAKAIKEAAKKRFYQAEAADGFEDIDGLLEQADLQKFSELQSPQKKEKLGAFYSENESAVRVAVSTLSQKKSSQWVPKTAAEIRANELHSGVEARTVLEMFNGFRIISPVTTPEKKVDTQSPEQRVRKRPSPPKFE